jgi:cytochrome c oxidase assembly factor 1
VLLATTVVGVTGWAAFYFFATNEEKVSSSVVQQVMKTLREDSGVSAFLGDAIRPEPAWYLNGSPLINGNVIPHFRFFAL